ncbi:pyridoxamine 5'-phosphate oxidase family protein [Amycolatopsis acidiphila]|uniref:Pyridoxamine 5'-phosphate oxidase family protein n=1 Tax=Amycolatopsis acidiphila TaxID=715473 RepID=A0A558AHD8_9PSEU|nr:pyridoxamine 5'-phosphate oxidase family protein [Amycolatopsis acidiphila]TVT23678.1 pyridoxamine 5'-phosphate oxidase family protein [Amycolatopsis acidiphila]UIJ58670.1 pyridoxamine 5'-phosphate oxidase family protein [Amycolatopsis acidiphila]GHG76112.1 pyridoxamine 5'-phosphate oxidase [Amycolatopsis acidiphila]
METRLDTRYSADDATAIPWAQARKVLTEAEVSWLTTIRPDGRPHVTTLLAVWLDDSAYFCTGAEERKGRNLAENPHVALTTGCNRLHEGLDVVLEGDAVRVRDTAKLRRIAEAYEAKYGSEWRFTVSDDGAFLNTYGDEALVYEIAPVTAFGFGKGLYSQTRWRF